MCKIISSTIFICAHNSMLEIGKMLVFYFFEAKFENVLKRNSPFHNNRTKVL